LTYIDLRRIAAKALPKNVAFIRHLNHNTFHVHYIGAQLYLSYLYNQR